MNSSLIRSVWERAGYRCEYCHIPHPQYRLPFQIDHIRARQHGGQTTPENLALACFHCNRHKGPNLAGWDLERQRLVRLFHPRTDLWHNHFQWKGAEIDLQFRLHRLAAAEHNLFAIGHDEQGERWNPGHPESHAALTMAETLRHSGNPLALLTLYESRLNRRFLQTLKQLRDIQADRHFEEQRELAELAEVAAAHPQLAEKIMPTQFGFVCSTEQWQFYRLRRQLLPHSAASAKSVDLISLHGGKPVAA